MKGTRYYQVDGNLLVSVTTPLKVISAPALEVWKAKIGEHKAKRIARKASKFGTKVHSYCEKIAKGEKLGKVPGKFEQSIKNFEAWFKSVEKVYAVEIMLYSLKWGIGGTADLICKMRGDDFYTIVDIKTGRIHPYAALQVAAYRKMAEDLLDIEVKRGIILSIRHDRKNPKPVECVVKSHPKKCNCMNDTVVYDEYWQIYWNLLKIWKWKEEVNAK